MGKFLSAVAGAFLLGISLLPRLSAQTASVVDYVGLELPKPGANALHVLSPTVLELVLINAKAPDPAKVDSWDFVDENFQFETPAANSFYVTANGQPIAVQSVGFKRRPLYAPLARRDLRIDNRLVLTLGAPIVEGQTVEVTNPTGAVYPATMRFIAVADPNRYSPAIHVNQQGYTPAFAKKAMVGYYLGNLGELPISAGTQFRIVNSASGAQVFSGTLIRRRDVGYDYQPTPYQNVYEANFTAFNTPGEYRLVVPGLGSSLPFVINDGVPMSFARAYALGLYHQRCGMPNAFPFTRHTHNACHTNLADIPTPQSSFAFTWNTIAGKTLDATNNPRHTATPMRSQATQLYPFVNSGKRNVSGGHHDAGDYSKYTVNSAALIHFLMFAVDSFPGAADLDNLGLPESGDGTSDLMQEAKWEADFLAKLQDADGGFYFLVYPREREYEFNVLPDQGDPQVVWPKTTAVTAAAVAALAQTASSPRFKQRYPTEAAQYLQQAHLGWNFLTNAIARLGKDGAYQKITHYGDEFMHDDELAWAACQMYLATTNASYQQRLISWYEPTSPNTRRWGWWHMSESYGRAARSYAFGARSGRVTAGHLDATYRAKCENELFAAAEHAVSSATNNAYGVSLPLEDKDARTAGWFFPSARAFDVASAYQLSARADYLETLIGNVNYEAGCNPANVSFITGLGWKRQREIVHQYVQNDRRVLPMSGLPIGAIHSSFMWIAAYAGELGALCYPQDGLAFGPFPYYDRWADAYNVTTEFVIADQGPALGSMAFLAGLTSLKTQAWVSGAAQILAPSQAALNLPTTMSVQTPGMNLADARVVWEARDQEPAFGTNFTFAPKSLGTTWVEVEATWPDGRRVFATTNIFVTNGPPAVTVVASDATASETGDPAVFTFSRSVSNSTLTVFFTLSGSAANGVHYNPVGNSITFPLNAPTRTLSVVPINNSATDGNRTVVLTLTSNASYAVALPNQGAATIFDDEINLVPQVAITNPAVTSVYLANTNSMLFLQASANDDGKPSPPARLNLSWNRVSGLGSVTFTSTNSTGTSARFSAPGNYVLRFTANDGQYSGVDEIAVTVDVDNAVAAGLQAYWKFSEPNGVPAATDASGNNRHATISGATLTAGRFNNAIELDGVDDYASFPSPDLNQISVAGWIRVDGNGDSTNPRVIEMPGFNVRLKRDATLGHSLSFESERSGTPAEWRTDLGTITDGVWLHFAVAYDPYVPGFVPQMYLNSMPQNVTEIGTGTGSLVSNVGTGYIGNTVTLDRSYDGRIDELRVYSRIIDSNEVRTLSYQSVSNIAPAVNTGPDQTVFTNLVTLRPAVTDDGKPTPPGALSHAWSQVSGPGSAVISNATTTTTRVWLPTPGKYNLRLQSTDGEAAMADEVEVTYHPAPEITRILRQNQMVTVTCEAVPGRTYRLLGKMNLSDPTWIALSGNLVADSAFISITVTNAETQRFYKVSAQ